MSINFELSKKVEFALEKVGLANITAQVAAVFDVSGSTQELFYDGHMQKALNVLAHVAFNLDDNNNLDTFIFSNSARQISEGVVPENYVNYIKDYVTISDYGNILWRGTYYSQFIQMLIDTYESAEHEEVVEAKHNSLLESASKFVKSIFCSTPDPLAMVSTEENFPVFAIILTDGEDSEQEQTKARFDQYSNANIFWQFVGIGDDSFNFIKKLAVKYDNIGFASINDLTAQSDEDLLGHMISEKFSTWFKAKHPNSK